VPGGEVGVAGWKRNSHNLSGRRHKAAEIKFPNKTPKKSKSETLFSIKANPS
jgi:hypothetical protein